MWSLFGGDKNKLVGIDIGTSGIKVAELEHSPSLKEVELRNYALVGFKENLPQKERERRITKEEIIELLKATLTQGKIKTKNSSFSIPSFSSFLSFVTMPRVRPEDLKKAITIEAQKFIPVSLEEVVLGWEVIDEPEGKDLSNIRDQNKMKVLLLAVPRDIVNRYKEIANACGLKLQNLEVEAFPLLRSLTQNYQKTFVIADIGSRVCNLLVVSSGSLRGARNIGLGGEDLTEILARSINIDYDRAEELKKEEGFHNKQVAELFTPVLGNVIDEIRRVIAMYKSKNPNKEIDEIILSGGTANLKGLVDLFSSKLNLPTSVGDPWKKLTIGDQAKSAAVERGTTFSIAIGLALKNE